MDESRQKLSYAWRVGVKSPLPKMCWFEDSVVAEAPRPVARPPPAPSVPAPAARSTTPPLPASPQLVAQQADIPTEVVEELVKEVVEGVAAEQQGQEPTTIEEPIVEEVSNMETYSIEAEDGRRLELASYVNSSGVRMVEIRADQGVQMRLTTLQHCITTIVESAARVDEMEQLERERQAEFDSCADMTVGVSIVVLLITLAICVYSLLVSQGAAGMVY